MKKSDAQASVNFLNRWLDFQFEMSSIVGLSVSVMHKTETVFTKTYGFADQDSGELFKPEHMINVGSQAKMFTATAIFLLIEQTELSLKDKVADHLGWLYDHPDVRVHKITLEQLLTHRAGLAREGDDARFWHLESPFPDEAQLKKLVLRSKMYVEGYVKYKYSNLGYALLGLIIKKLSGVPFGDFIEQSIIKPLALTNTIAEFSHDKLPQIATSYSALIGGKRYAIPKTVYTNNFTSVAGIYSTPQDMCKFLSANFYGDFLSKTAQLGLHDEKYNHWLPQVYRGSRYGAGFFLADFNGRKIIGHSGGFTGYRTATFYDPKTEITVSVANTTREEPVFAILDGILNVFDFFNKYGVGPEKYNVAARNLWVNIFAVSTRRAVFLLQADGWNVFSTAEELAQIEENKFTIKRASDNAYLGEQVEFFYKKNELDFIKYAGLILRSDSTFTKWLKDFSRR